MRRLVCFVLAMTVLSGIGFSQNLQERLSKFPTEFAKGYTAPFTDAFGASLNSGWYHTANVDDGLDLFFGVKVMLMPIPDDAKIFRIQSPYPGGGVDEPSTAFGEKKAVSISGDTTGRQPTTYPEGFDIGFVPMLVPHISVGNIFGTRVMLRYLPKVNVGDMGEFEFFGIGAQHNVGQYIPAPLPIDIAALIAYQSLSLGDLVSANAFTFGAQASKTFTIFTVYGGLAYESSTMTFTYDKVPNSIPGPNRISFDADGKNSFRATIGFALSLAIVKITADYSLASQPIATVGFGIGW
jgi:hypothetical protein